MRPSDSALVTLPVYATAPPDYFFVVKIRDYLFVVNRRDYEKVVTGGVAGRIGWVRVLVTGAGGYLGRVVVRAMRGRGCEVVAMGRGVDLFDAGGVRRVMEGVDAVCHLAGVGQARESVADPVRYFRVNAGGTVALLEAMEDVGVGRLVFASTGAIYGSPERQPMSEELPDAPPHPYAASKLAAEWAIEAQVAAGKVAACVLRLMNVAGGEDPDPTRLIPRTLAAAASGSALEINGDGSAVRDYLHVEDAAAAFVAGAEPATGFSRYVAGSGRGTSVLEVVAAVERITGRRIAVTHRPAVQEPSALVADSSRAVTELGWKPMKSDIDTIVRDTRG
ncbi:NAD-dependent epimerase/dehydratase family protein [Nocardia puris]|uniref:NAD-dependent epimerase/dehydratase family protein n=1 Tax=Nocardia puris TaxID=208602 RepID=UPI002E1E0305